MRESSKSAKTTGESCRSYRSFQVELERGNALLEGQAMSGRLTVNQAVLHIEQQHGVRYEPTTIRSWVNRGRRKADGEVRFLEKKQMGHQSRIEIEIDALERFIAWLKSE